MSNRLHFGDNLHVLRKYVDTNSVDLIYLDPPFNSNATYSILFKTPTGDRSRAQAKAFEDTWEWGPNADAAMLDIEERRPDLHEFLQGLKQFLGKSNMMAYMAMMSVRLLELHRVLKSTGSLYLHCDPTASHYIKIVCDAIFGAQNFRNEIIWRRSGAHNKSVRWAPIHDTLLFYSKSDDYIWNHPRQPYMMGHVEEHFVADEHGYKTAYYGNVLTGSGKRNGESGLPWRGIDPTAKNRHWAIPGKLWEDSGLNAEGLSQHQKLDLLYKGKHAA